MVTMQELKRYKDTGCKYYPSCLNCPEPVCIYELGRGGVVRANKRDRNEAIVKAIRQGKTANEVAELFGISASSVKRVSRDEMPTREGIVNV